MLDSSEAYNISGSRLKESRWCGQEMQPDYQFVGYAEAMNVVLREPLENCIPGFALGKLHIVLCKAS